MAAQLIGQLEANTPATVLQGVHALWSDIINKERASPHPGLEDADRRELLTQRLAHTVGGVGIDPAAIGDIGQHAAVTQTVSTPADRTDSLTVTSPDRTSSETVTVIVSGSGMRDPNSVEWADLSGSINDRARTERAGTTVTFTPEGSGIESRVTDSVGRFAFELPTGIAGHLDAKREYDPGVDRNLTARDALDVLRLVLGIAPSWGPATAIDFIAADINQDGQASAADALDVLRAAVGLQIDNLPRWVFLDSAADLSEISRSNTAIETGVRIDALTAGLAEVSMTGILLGSMQEFV